MQAGETGNYQHAAHERLPGARGIWGYGGKGSLYDDGRQVRKKGNTHTCLWGDES
jgi:hypothetical protein